MKILYNIAGTYRSGGMERVLANKSNWLVANGYDVVIVTTDQCGRSSFFKLDDRIRCYDLDINYEKNNNSSIWKKITQFPYKQYIHKKRLSLLLQKENPDIVISMFCNDVNFITDISNNSRTILEIHFSKFKRLQYNRKGLWKLLDIYLSRKDERLVRKFDKFVVLTSEDKHYWSPFKEAIVIPNALSYRNTEVSSLKNKKAIAVGRLTYQKGFDRLIEVWRIVNKECPDWILEIIGEGEDRVSLEKQIEGCGLGSVIHISPPTLRVDKKYLESSLLIMTSRYEGFGLVLIEAQSYGLPTIAFNCKCGPSDIIQNEVNGYLIEDGDINGMAMKIIKLISNQSELNAMGNKAKENSVKYDESQIMRRWAYLFDQVLL